MTDFQKIYRDNASVYFVDYSESYFVELYEQYPWILDRISGILTHTADRVNGSVTKGSERMKIMDREVPILPYEALAELDSCAFFIILGDYFMETYEKMNEISAKSHKTIPNLFFYPNETTRIQLDYQERLQNCPLEKMIVFRSGPHESQCVDGMDFDDNAKALFEYMLGEGYDNKWHLVWLVKDATKYAGKYSNHPNVEFIPYHWAGSANELERDKYYHALFLSKFLFFTDAYGFARNCRPDQIRVQLWHGCGFKTRINFSRCEKRYEYNIVISKVYQEIHERIYGLRRDQVLITGYPKEDWLFTPCIDWRERFGIPYACKYLFWMPTFRKASEALSELNEAGFTGETGLPILHTVKELMTLNQMLRERDTVLLLKLHPFQKRAEIKVPALSNIYVIENADLIREGLNINQILGNADALISDYSSTAVDYLILNRPMAFTLEDLETYEDSRGFVFENVREWFPGMEIWNKEDFLEFVMQIAEGRDPYEAKRNRIRNKMHDFSDGHSCRRLLEKLGIENL